jgi:hypothetical protein
VTEKFAIATGLLEAVELRLPYPDKRFPLPEETFATPPPDGRPSTTVVGVSGVTVRVPVPVLAPKFGPGL